VTREQQTPEIYLSMPHSCSYLPDRMASTLFVDPRFPLDSAQFGRFMQLGFRRSGDLVYRPHCPECGACVPVRVPVTEFRATRGQRRVWKRNGDLRVDEHPPVFSREHFDLYQRYQTQRHPGGGMDDPDPQKYTQFLVGSHMDSTFYEFRLADRLMAVAVVDQLPDGLSAVYTFYDPAELARGLGVYAVLWEIERARALGLPYLYLGYWIESSRKMAYKAGFSPLEVYRQGRWSQLAR
jgi:arginine-tRNA-protein transferase